MKINRRQLLTAAGTIFALPLLETFAPKRAIAGGAADPRRFVSLYMPNGTYNIQGDAVWYPPAGALSANNLPAVLSPFGAHVSDFSVLMHPACRARDDASAKAPDGGGHLGAVTTFLSHAVLTDFNSNQCTVPGSSFDQRVADAAGKPNLVMSCGCNSGSPDASVFNYADYVSYKNGQVNEPHKNPVELYAQVFANLVQTPQNKPPAYAAARNKSILDASLGDIKDLQSRLGKNDNRKLDEHFASIRALETKLYGAPPSVASGCTPGKTPDSTLNNVDVDGTLSDTYIARAQAFFDMIVLAFRCDLVRSVSFMYDGEVAGRENNACPSSLVYDNASLTAQLHIGISHYGQNSEGKARTISRDRMYLSLFFYLLDALKAATDPSGSTILDNTIVMAGYNVIDGEHNGNSEGTPLVVGGGKNFMHPGNCFDLNGADLADVLYTFSTFLSLGMTDFQGHNKLVSV